MHSESQHYQEWRKPVQRYQKSQFLEWHPEFGRSVLTRPQFADLHNKQLLSIVDFAIKKNIHLLIAFAILHLLHRYYRNWDFWKCLQSFPTSSQWHTFKHHIYIKVISSDLYWCTYVPQVNITYNTHVLNMLLFASKDDIRQTGANDVMTE